jgi:hypothetical protein
MKPPDYHTTSLTSEDGILHFDEYSLKFGVAQNFYRAVQVASNITIVHSKDDGPAHGIFVVNTDTNESLFIAVKTPTT